MQTIDRVLDIMLIPPIAKRKKRIRQQRARILSESPSTASPEPDESSWTGPDGLEPPLSQRIDVDEWERKRGRVLTQDDTDEVARLVSWCFVRLAHLWHLCD